VIVEHRTFSTASSLTEYDEAVTGHRKLPLAVGFQDLLFDLSNTLSGVARNARAEELSAWQPQQYTHPLIGSQLQQRSLAAAATLAAEAAALAEIEAGEWRVTATIVQRMQVARELVPRLAWQRSHCSSVTCAHFDHYAPQVVATLEHRLFTVCSSLEKFIDSVSGELILRTVGLAALMEELDALLAGAGVRASTPAEQLPQWRPQAWSRPLFGDQLTPQLPHAQQLQQLEQQLQQMEEDQLQQVQQQLRQQRQQQQPPAGSSGGGGNFNVSFTTLR
jgi:hypothetical protein